MDSNVTLESRVANHLANSQTPYGRLYWAFILLHLVAPCLHLGLSQNRNRNPPNMGSSFWFPFKPAPTVVPTGRPIWVQRFHGLRRFGARKSGGPARLRDIDPDRAIRRACENGPREPMGRFRKLVGAIGNALSGFGKEPFWDSLKGHRRAIGMV